MIVENSSRSGNTAAFAVGWFILWNSKLL